MEKHWIITKIRKLLAKEVLLKIASGVQNRLESNPKT
jgi:hypothetical protein